MKFLYIIFLSMVFFLSACDQFVEKKFLSADINDKSIKNLTQPIVEKKYIPKPIKKPQIPIIPKKFLQKISLTFNENVSVKSILYETAQKLNIDFQIDPLIDAHVLFQAKDKPFINILDAICDIADLRYTINDGFVKVVKDEPYTVLYELPFLDFSRNSENNISIPTEIGSVSKNDKSSKHHSLSANRVTIAAKNDFWKEIKKNIQIILEEYKSEKNFIHKQDNKKIEKEVTTNEENKKEQIAIKNKKRNKCRKCSINRQAGIISIFANSKVQKQIAMYIQKIKEISTSQVSIEAKIIEVVLKNGYKRGIEWDKINEISQIKSNDGIFSFFSDSVLTMKKIVKVLEEFGSTRTISNPRITVINNQAAILKVAQNHVYFELKCKMNGKKGKKNNIIVNSKIKTVPIGLLLFVLPSIDRNNNTITLFLRPTISKLANSVKDPAVEIIMQNQASNNQTTSQIPITETREIVSVLKIRDGGITVLGGFMEVRSNKKKSGIPVVGKIPFIGELASSQNNNDEIIELVILIKATIVQDNDDICEVDTRLLRFVPDPRAF